MKAFEMMCLRTVEGVTRLDRVSIRKVRKALAVIDMIKEKQRKRKTKLEQRSEDRLI